MKKITTVLVLLFALLFAVTAVYAADSNVDYLGSAGDFVFAPGSSYSPTDLFSNFKDVMPGDNITQKITVRNDAAKNVKAKLYVRSLGADDATRDFCSKLKFTLTKSDANEMPYMFNGDSAFTADNDGWIYLGTLYSGGTVDLDLVLSVPTDLDNRYANSIGRITWEFKAEELPVESSDPVPPPKTGDKSALPIGIVAVSGAAVAVLLVLVLKKSKNQNVCFNE